MDWLLVVTFGLALAVDATVVSITNGMVFQKIKRWKIFVAALTFGIMQGLMPLLGYIFGSLTELAEGNLVAIIENLDHWIAFVLLALIGGKMIYDTVKEMQNPEDIVPKTDISYREIFIQGIATSIDAFAVGITLYTAAQIQVKPIPIYWQALIICIITLILSILGSLFGKKLGQLFKKVAPIIGGVVLITIGIYIVIEHIG